MELGYEVTPFDRGLKVGPLLVVLVGELNEGDADGSSVGVADGSCVGHIVGRIAVGVRLGFFDGLAVGTF